MVRLKFPCGICKEPVNWKTARKLEQKHVCFKCFKKKGKLFNSIDVMPFRGFSIEKALSKTYTIKGYIRNKRFPERSFTGNSSFPSILIGHKVKLVLVD